MNISNNKIEYNIHTPKFNGINKKELHDDSPVKENDIINSQDDCWKLHKAEVLEQFIKSDEELNETLSDTLKLARVYGLTPSIDLFNNLRNNREDVKKFYEIMKSNYNIDLDIPPKVYRFVGKSEIEALKKDGIVKPQRGYWEKIDVTLNPDLNWNEYRITFKPKKEFSVLDKASKIKENPGTGHDYFYFHEGPYTMDDVECIEQYRIY